MIIVREGQKYYSMFLEYDMYLFNNILILGVIL